MTELRSAAPDDVGQPLLITGPHLVTAVHPQLHEALADLWFRVNQAHGAADFATSASREVIGEAARRVAESVAARREHMLVLGRDNDIVGCAFLVPESGQVTKHRGRVARLMVDPTMLGRGWGSVLLTAVVSLARAHGLEQLEATARGAVPGLQRFYTDRGWSLAGRWRQSLKLSERDVRDEMWFVRDV